MCSTDHDPRAGSYVKSGDYLQSGLVEYSVDDLHSATYMRANLRMQALFIRSFTGMTIPTWIQLRVSKSKIGYSFVIRYHCRDSFPISSPCQLGILMAKKEQTG